MANAYVGVYGMGVMGQSLALNIANHGYSVAVGSRKAEKIQIFMAEKAADRADVHPFYSLEEFVNGLERPRRIILMVTAGAAVDQVIAQLIPLVSSGDIIVDGGNSFYADTCRRELELKKYGIHFFGVGISGGEKGALEGPCMMPGGDRKAFNDSLLDLFASISAKAEDGTPCCTYIGSNGAGHYVKMVHNGIEYADIQLICECYDLMRKVAGLNAKECQQVFEFWNRGRLNSYLIEITAKILNHIDSSTGKPLVDVILDTAEQKGTGKWTSAQGLAIGVAVPSIAQAVFSRFLSAAKEERVKASADFTWPILPVENRTRFLEQLEESLYAAKICSYAQGFSLLRAAADKYSWDLDYSAIALIWRGGCIIRAGFLDDIAKAYQTQPTLINLLRAPVFVPALQAAQESWREIAALSIKNGISCPSLVSALNYFDFYRTADCPANLLQAQRDFFGAHTYRRKDREGNFHTQWEC